MRLPVPLRPARCTLSAMTRRPIVRGPLLSRAAGLGILVVLLAVVVPAAPAWAHAKLVSTDPATGATVAAPVATITLTFNEPVKQQFTTVVVTGADGASYSDGPARSVDKQVLQTVKPLPSGAIRVTWKTVSPDGDPIQGTFSFTNAAPAPTSAAASPSPSAAATTSPAPAGTSSTPEARTASNDEGPGGLVWLLVAAVIVLALLAGGAYWFRSRRQRTGSSG